MFVLALLICVVLRAFSAQAKVVTDFNECKEFFYKDTEPSGMDQNAKKICQYLGGIGPYYATLYSIYHKNPLYSAYIFDHQCNTDSGRSNIWHLEPQVTMFFTVYQKTFINSFSSTFCFVIPYINHIMVL